MRSYGKSGRLMLAGATLLLGGLALPSWAEDLAEIYALSKQSDPKYRAARFDFEAAAFAEPQALAALLPSATYEYGTIETKQKILSSANAVYATGMSKYASDNQTLTITQPIFKLSAWRGYEQSKTKVKQAGSTFAAAEQDLMLRVATAYLSVLAAQDGLGFSGAERDAIKRQLDLVQQRFSSGLVAIAALHEARARFAIKEADVVAAQNDLDDKQQALRELTGKVFSSLKALPETIPLGKPEPAEMSHWVESALKQNLLLEARRQTVEIARQEIERQRAAHYPVVDIVGTNNRKATGGSLFGGGSNVETTDLMLRINVPLYAGGLPTAMTGESMKRYYSSLEDLERDSRQTERQARAAFQGVTGGIVRVTALAQGVVSSESARELKVEGLKAGLETVLQVLDAERDLYAAKRDSAKARYDFLLNKLRLKQAVGTLGEEDLAAISSLMK